MAINSYYPVPKLEEYSERFKDFFSFKRENGILEVKMHTNGGPVKWSYQFHETALEYQEKYRIREIGDIIEEKGVRLCRINDLDGQWWEYQWRDKTMGRWYEDEFLAGDVTVV